jgi:hypothetical protein
MAEQTFSARGAGTPQSATVMYCLGALEKFDKMPRAEVQPIASENTMKGGNGTGHSGFAQEWEPNQPQPDGFERDFMRHVIGI